MFNITISNVPGPDQPLYFRGAELVAIYPASIVTHGQALNITCESYAGAMNFGFTGCHASLPSMQRLAVYAEEALAELEAAMRPTPKPAPGSRKGSAKTAPSAVMPAKAKVGKPSAGKATVAGKAATVRDQDSKATGNPVVARKPVAARRRTV
jgi:hypothetical protein